MSVPKIPPHWCFGGIRRFSELQMGFRIKTTEIGYPNLVMWLYLSNGRSLISASFIFISSTSAILQVSEVSSTVGAQLLRSTSSGVLSHGEAAVSLMGCTPMNWMNFRLNHESSKLCWLFHFLSFVLLILYILYVLESNPAFIQFNTGSIRSNLRASKITIKNFVVKNIFSRFHLKSLNKASNNFGAIFMNL